MRVIKISLASPAGVGALPPPLSQWPPLSGSLSLSFWVSVPATRSLPHISVPLFLDLCPCPPSVWIPVSFLFGAVSQE